MEFVQKARGYSGNKEELEEEEEDEEIKNIACNNLPFSSSPSNYSNSTLYDFLPHQYHPSRSFHHSLPPTLDAATNVIPGRNAQLMDLSLRIDNDDGGGTVGGGGRCPGFIEREHMFDKVVTPSDVGKLNRLVIPKQHAERYFPLDSSTNEKGLILNFEDRNGKPWRFRYSYWNSSQSYVMTKGWSRFVKEKKLDAGDIVSFERGVGELGKNRLYIDWRRRPDAPANLASLTAHLPLPNQPAFFPQSIRWGGRQLVPPSMAVQPPQHHRFQNLNYSSYPYPHYYPNANYNHEYNVSNMGSNSFYYLRPTMYGARDRQQGEEYAPMVIDSVPVVFEQGCKRSGAAKAKRLRLFGVNMECSIPAEETGNVCDMSSSTTNNIPQQVVVSNMSSNSSSSLSLDHHHMNIPPDFNSSDLSRRSGKASLSLDWEIQDGARWQ